ncbi:MAG: Mur ligase domain-containing protein, partial [bacterium]|nr:Mur ligase domain-containing protein [bacterium]
MKYIHLIGICGTGMGSLAGLFKEAGFKVSGSDTQFYPPMGDQIKALEIKLYTGFDPENLAEKPDIVIIGNVCRADNPEAVEALKLKIKYYSLPQALQEFFLKNKKAIVVAGTHGKTTTTCLLAWVLTSAGLDPGFLIGGVGLNLGKSFQLGKGDYFVVEGDEYDSAFFDKGPKFAHYKPAGAILTSLEWDHVDIYPTFEKMFGAFEKLTATLSEKTPLLAWMDSPK